MLSDGGLPLLHLARARSLIAASVSKKKAGQRFPLVLVYYSCTTSELLMCLIVGACRGPVSRAHEVLSRVKTSSDATFFCLYCQTTAALLRCYSFTERVYRGHKSRAREVLSRVQESSGSGFFCFYQTTAVLLCYYCVA